MARSQISQDSIRLGPDDNKYYFKDAETTGPSLAGLLGFSNTKDMGKWLNSQTVKDLWIPYSTFRSQGFGSLTPKAVPISLKECMLLWGLEDTRVLLDNENIPWPAVPNQTRPLLVTLWYAKRLVCINPDVFSKFIGYPEGAENVARAVRTLRFMWDRTVKQMDVAPTKSQPATIPTYYNPNGPPAPTRARVSQITNLQEEDKDELEPLNSPRDTTDPEVEEITTLLEQKLINSVDSLIGTKDSALIGINPTARVAFMKAIAGKAEAIRLSTAPFALVNQNLVEAANNAVGLELDNEGGDLSEIGETQAFWALQQEIASLSCNKTPSYEASKFLFSTNENNEPCVEGLALKPWQIIGANWMLEQEASFLGGGIVADGCGLGKTIQTLAFLMAALQRDLALGPQAIYKPTLIIAPPLIIQIWIDEWRDHFAKSFAMRVLHSGWSQVPWVKKMIMSMRDVKEMWEVGGIAHPRNKDTARLLIVTSYETFTRRQKAGLGQDWSSAWAGKFRRLICDEGHKLKGRKTEVWTAVDSLRARYKWLLTATPLINRVTDYLGYLTLFFRPEWAKAYDKEDALKPYIDFLALPPESQTISEGLHLLNPELFLANVVHGDIETGRAKHILQAISRIIQLQRTTASVVRLEGGTTQRIGDAIPPFKARTVELDLSGRVQAEYKKSHEALIPSLRRKNPNAQSQDKEEPQIVFNNHYLRRLSHLSFSILLERFVRKVSRNGVQEIDKFREYRDLGAQYFTRHTMLGWGMPVPHMCADLVEFLTNHSPKLAYLCGLLAEIVLEKGEKVVLFAEWPLVVWLTEMMLGLLDLPYLAIRASTRLDKRTEIIHQFNDEDHSTRILITTFKTCSLGINLQKACHNMVILEPARNINTLLQAVGRLNRVGQTRMQEVTILFQEYTFNRWLEYIASKKFMAQIAGSRYGNSQEDLERTIMRMLGQGQSRLAMKEMRFSAEKGPGETSSSLKGKKRARSEEDEENGDEEDGDEEDGGEEDGDEEDMDGEDMDGEDGDEGLENERVEDEEDEDEGLD